MTAEEEASSSAAMAEAVAAAMTVAAVAAETAAAGSPIARVLCTAGIHPHDALTFNAESTAELRALLGDPLCVAVGECGLDYDREFTTRKKISTGHTHTDREQHPRHTHTHTHTTRTTP